MKILFGLCLHEGLELYHYSYHIYVYEKHTNSMVLLHFLFNRIGDLSSDQI